jgi:hypothetical protein
VRLGLDPSRDLGPPEASAVGHHHESADLRAGPGEHGPAAARGDVPGAFHPGNFPNRDQCLWEPVPDQRSHPAKTVPLVDCPGQAGLSPAPSTRIGVGGEVTIAGLPRSASITVTPAGLLRAYGTTYVGVHSGIAHVVIHDYTCDQPGGSSCALVNVQVG